MNAASPIRTRAAAAPGRGGHGRAARDPAARDPAAHDDEIVVPKPVIYLTMAMIAFAIVAVATARLLQWGVTHEGALAPAREASFRYVQSLHGPVVATRLDGRRVTLAPANEELFPRLIIRSVANIRARDNADPAAPLRLVETGDGERLIVDAATRRTVRLAAFGPENQRMFDRIFDGAAR